MSPDHVSPAEDTGATPTHDETPAPKPDVRTNGPEAVPTPARGTDDDD